MTARDVASTLRSVSSLSHLGARLPHVPTPAERRLLVRFDELAASPARAGESDVDAIAAGWRGWWRAGRSVDIVTMARRLPAGVTRGDRRLAMYVVAASATVDEGSERG